MNMDEMTEPGNLSKAKRDWEDLLKNPAWVQLVEAVQAQTDTLQQSILFGPVRTAEDLYKCEREKGMLEGRLSITATAHAMKESIEVDLNEALNRKGSENVEEE